MIHGPLVPHKGAGNSISCYFPKETSRNSYRCFPSTCGHRNKKQSWLLTDTSAPSISTALDDLLWEELETPLPGILHSGVAVIIIIGDDGDGQDVCPRDTR